MKSRWPSRLIRILIGIFMFVLILNSYVLAREIKSDISFQNRSYGLSVMNECFDNGEYYKIFHYALKNDLAEDEPYIDVSQYEAFGRFYNAYLKAKMYPDNNEYRIQMETEKAKISWKKILNVMAILEEDLNN